MLKEASREGSLQESLEAIKDYGSYTGYLAEKALEDVLGNRNETKKGQCAMIEQKSDGMLAMQKTALLEAVENTYEDSKFFVGRGIPDDCDFTQGYFRNRTEFITKDALLEEIKASQYDLIVSMPDFSENLVLDPKTYVVCDRISDNQIYHTDAPDGYYHSINTNNPHLEVFIKIDRENMTISFLLGSHQRTLPLEVRPGYGYELHETKLYCESIDDLEEYIKDEYWNPSFITIGRMALGLEGCQPFESQ